MLWLQKVRRFNWVPCGYGLPEHCFLWVNHTLKKGSTKAVLKEIGVVNFFIYMVQGKLKIVWLKKKKLRLYFCKEGSNDHNISLQQQHSIHIFSLPEQIHIMNSICWWIVLNMTLLHISGGLKFLIMKKDCCLKSSIRVMLILPTKLLCNSIFGANIPEGAI